jgi:phospholipid/cholesterol/gamma-HCH transport system substrate-binding protein
MQKRAPTLGNILVIILFVLSCFGLLMFLWESFGGPLPLKPKGYRMTVSFPRSLALAEESDVRISGVEVGHVVSLHLGNDGRNHATLEIAQQYAPIRANMHAILREKTLLGETYIQLIPEGKSGPFLGDGKQLPNSQVEPSVTLDDILSAFNSKTRHDFQVWMQDSSEGLNGHGARTVRRTRQPAGQRP